VSYHDQLPKYTNGEKRKLVSKIHTEQIQKLNVFIEAMENFAADPEREGELGEKMIEAHEDWHQLFIKWKNHPIARVKLNDAETKSSLNEKLAQLTYVTDKFHVEIQRRIDDPNFEVDLAIYKRAARQLKKKVEFRKE